ncbi:hypothetical protein T439DRAFT_19808 [Meredithblackwellia eburnea MCA 4105]
MSLDIATPGVLEAYASIQQPESSDDWFSLSYRETRDKLFLAASGQQGIVELKTKLNPNEIQYGLLRVEGRLLLWTFMPEDVSGVRRARALVHSRAIGTKLSSHQATFTAASIADFTLSTVRKKLKLDGSTSSPSSPAPGSAPFATPSPIQTSTPSFSPAAVVVVQDEEDGAPPVPSKVYGIQSLVTGVDGLGISGDVPGPLRRHTPPMISPSSSMSLSPREGPVARTQQNLPPRTSSAGQLHSPPLRPSQLESTQSLQHLRTGSPSPTSTPTPSPPPPPIRSDSASAMLPENRNEARSPSIASQPSPAEEAFEAGKRAQQAIEKEEADRLERIKREKAEKEAADKARIQAEADARAKWESEERERERLDEEERRMLEREELARREAAERLRREEQRRADAIEAARRKEEEAKQREEDEKERIAEELRTREAREEMRLMIEQERLQRKLEAEEEQRKKDEQERIRRKELFERFEVAAKSGGVMLTGNVTVQGGSSIYWKRRWFELRPADLKLFKSEQDRTAGKPLDVVELPNKLRMITDDPEEAAIANSFKLTFKGPDEEDILFYTDEKEDKELLVTCLKMAAKLP